MAHIATVRIIDRSVLRISRCHWQRTRQLGHFSMYVFFTSIGDYFRFHMDLLVVAKWIGIALVTPYSVAANLIAAFQNVMAGLCGPLMTELTRLDGADKEKTYPFFLRASKLTALLATLGAILLLANGRQLLGTWLGPGFVGVFGTVAVLTIAHWSDRAQSPSMHLLYSRGRHRPLAYWTIAEGIVNLILSIILGRRYGILGVALGTAVPMLLIKLVVQPWYTLYIARGSIPEYLTKSVLPPVAIGAFVWLVASFAAGTTFSIGSLLFNIVWQTALFLVTAYAFALSHQERAMVTSRLAWLLLVFQPRAPEQA
jgi:O-antigen/teichoic acid export membrane protein